MQNASPNQPTGSEYLWHDVDRYFAAHGAPALAVHVGLSVLLLLGAVIASYALSKLAYLLVRRVLRALDAESPGKEEAPRSLVRLLQISVWFIAVIIMSSLWGFNIASWRGGAVVAGVVRILLILILAVGFWELGGVALGGVFRRAAERSETARRAAQLRSLEPMTRSALRAVVAVFTGMIIISQAGVEIGPLIAGAGVVGIAVGFGAQTLTKDYLTGFSLILEDIVSVGDIVRIGDSGGLVETMALRTIRLRDFDGTLHVVPYSEPQTVHNLTKSFSYYVFDLPISYDSDIDAALALMRTVGAEMRSEPAFRDVILEAIEVVGVDKLGDSGVVLKARIKTQPVQQWSVGREYNRRIKLAFDKAGIEIPVPHLKLLLGERALAAVKAP